MKNGFARLALEASAGSQLTDNLLRESELRLRASAADLRRVRLKDERARQLHLRALGLKKALNGWSIDTDPSGVLTSIDALDNEVTRARERFGSARHRSREGARKEGFESLRDSLASAG